MIKIAACAVGAANANIPRLDNANAASPILQLAMPEGSMAARVSGLSLDGLLLSIGLGFGGLVARLRTGLFGLVAGFLHLLGRIAPGLTLLLDRVSLLLHLLAGRLFVLVAALVAGLFHGFALLLHLGAFGLLGVGRLLLFVALLLHAVPRLFGRRRLRPGGLPADERDCGESEGHTKH